MPDEPNSAPPEPRPFDPKDPPRMWLLESEHPPLWPEKFQVSGIEVSYPAGVLYRFYGAERQLLYIGIAAGDPTYRWTAHRYRSEWWHLATFVSVTHVTPVGSVRRAIERKAIRAERPLYNKEHLKPRVRLEIRLDQGAESVVEQLHKVMLPEDFAEVIRAFKAVPDVPIDPPATH